MFTTPSTDSSDLSGSGGAVTAQNSRAGLPSPLFSRTKSRAPRRVQPLAAAVVCTNVTATRFSEREASHPTPFRAFAASACERRGAADVSRAVSPRATSAFLAVQTVQDPAV